MLQYVRRLYVFLRVVRARLNSPSRLLVGRRVWIGRNASIAAIGDLYIADDVYIGKNVTIEVCGTIGRATMIANNVGIIGRLDHDLSEPGTPARFAPSARSDSRLRRPVHIGEGCWIGFGSVILSGVRVGDRATVGAGSVVTKDVPPGAVVAGSPAKLIG